MNRIAIPPPKKTQTPEEYAVERDRAAYKRIAERMDSILHGGDRNNSRAVTEYDVLGR